MQDVVRLEGLQIGRSRFVYFKRCFRAEIERVATARQRGNDFERQTSGDEILAAFRTDILEREDNNRGSTCNGCNATILVALPGVGRGQDGGDDHKHRCGHPDRTLSCVSCDLDREAQSRLWFSRWDRPHYLRGLQVGCTWHLFHFLLVLSGGRNVVAIGSVLVM